MKKVLFYANLNSQNSSMLTTDEQMEKFFIEFGYQEPFEAHGVYIDRCDEYRVSEYRRNWGELYNKCKTEHIDLIIVPTYTMVSKFCMDLLSIIHDFKEQFNTDFYFMRERFSTDEKEMESFIKLIALRADQEQQEEKESSKMRIRFQDINGVKAGCPSAKTIQLDDKLYRDAFKVSQKYGMSVEELIIDYLLFTINPDNESEFRKIMQIPDDD